MLFSKKLKVSEFKKFVEMQNENTKNTIGVIKEQQEQIERLQKFVALTTQVVTPQAPASFKDLQDGKEVIAPDTLKELLGYGK